MEGSIREPLSKGSTDAGGFLSGYGINSGGSLVVSAAEQRSMKNLPWGPVPDPMAYPRIADEKGIASPHFGIAFTAALVRWRFDGLSVNFLPGIFGLKTR